LFSTVPPFIAPTVCPKEGGAIIFPLGIIKSLVVFVVCSEI
jgi:hypothetical protein